MAKSISHICKDLASTLLYVNVFEPPQSGMWWMGTMAMFGLIYKLSEKELLPSSQLDSLFYVSSALGKIDVKTGRCAKLSLFHQTNLTIRPVLGLVKRYQSLTLKFKVSQNLSPLVITPTHAVEILPL